jgi:hypothetical protein
MATAIVSGALANKPLNGGEAWVRLSWVLGLRRLGFDAYFVEELAPGGCVDETGARTEFASSVNRDYFEAVISEFGLEGNAGLLYDGGREAVGLDLEQLRQLSADADLLVNLSGHLTLKEILAGPRTSIYVDLDPGFTQAWHADDQVPFAIGVHDHYVTVGLNVGMRSCPIPDCGLDWIPILPPVVLDEWPLQPPFEGSMRFTTVATWRSPFGPLTVDGRTMGLKHHQFRRLLELPGRVTEATFEIALDIHPGDSEDLDALRYHGWRIVDPRPATGSPGRFRDFLSASSAEFSVAQEVYTETGSGWFSDRTAAYLACGRPTLVQDTGLGDRLPIGEGLLTFSSLEEAASGVDRILADYAEHSTAARSLAIRYLDSDVVLGRLLSMAGIGG